MAPQRAVVLMGIRIAPDLAARVVAAAKRVGLSQNAWIERALAIQVVREDEALEGRDDAPRADPAAPSVG